MSYWYLASPYSKYPHGLDRACDDICEQAALLVSVGVRHVYSPIAHCHRIEKLGGLDPLDYSIWLPMQQPMIDAAKGMILCKLDGWDRSYGIGVELGLFRAESKPVFYMLPGSVPHGLLRAEGLLGEPEMGLA